jgi:phosphatidate cytidylyltransferase
VLRWRLLTAAFILTPLITLLALDVRCNGGVPGIWLIPGGWVLLLLATAEMLELMQFGVSSVRWTVYAGGSLVYLGACLPAMLRARTVAQTSGEPLTGLAWVTVALVLASMLVFVAEMLQYREPGQSIRRLALAVAAIVYPCTFLALLAQLRFVRDNAWGMAALVSLVFVVKLSDTAAYTAGKLCGRHKLAPLLSPGKTVEGAVGALAGAVLAAGVYFQWLVPWAMGSDAAVTSWGGCVLFGLLVGVAGMVGDLAESLFKRDAGRKDSSHWLPGLGGILDILDSLLLAAPVALFCWLIGMVGPHP